VQCSAVQYREVAGSFLPWRTWTAPSNSSSSSELSCSKVQYQQDVCEGDAETAGEDIIELKGYT
jgi:hypothetical protein